MADALGLLVEVTSVLRCLVKEAGVLGLLVVGAPCRDCSRGQKVQRCQACWSEV